MRILLQQPPATGETAKYVQLTLQPDLFGGWEVLRESGQIGGRSQFKREQFMQQEQATRAFEKLRDSHIKRGFRQTFAQGAEPPR